MRARALTHRDEDKAYAKLRRRLLYRDGVLVGASCEVCPRLHAAGVPTPHGLDLHTGLELHHRRKRSSTGALAEPANVLVSCHEGNQLVEAYPVEAHRVDLVVREGDPEWDQLGARAWRLAFHA